MILPNFHEHPPLAFILQSFFFKIFGNAFYTERIYSLLTAVLTLFGISRCWRLVAENDEQKQYDWLPILIWISIPIVVWSYKNNMLENTMSVFTIFAVFCLLKSVIENKIIYLFVGGILVLLALLTKGFVGLFPIAVPLIYSIVYKKISSIFYFLYLLLFTLFIAYVMTIMLPGLKENLMLYFDQQLLPALNNKREITTNNRFSIIPKLIIEMSLPILILIVAFIKYRKNKSLHLTTSKEALLFFLVAVSASIPLIISLKQRKFYLTPSIPFYVLCICLYVYPFFKSFIENKIKSSLLWIKRLSIVLLLGISVFAVVRFGKISKDKEKLHDVYVLSKYLPEGTILATRADLCSDWGLIAYLSRIGYLSLDCKNEREYLLLNKADSQTIVQYNNIDLGLHNYKLLKKSNKTIINSYRIEEITGFFHLTL